MLSNASPESEGVQRVGEALPVELLLLPALELVHQSIGSTTGCTITEKAPTRAFSWLKAATTAFTFKTLLRHTMLNGCWWSLNVKLGPWHNYHKGRAAIRLLCDYEPSDGPFWSTNTHTALCEGQNVNIINYVVLKAVNSEVKKQFELWQGIFL